MWVHHRGYDGYGRRFRRDSHDDFQRHGERGHCQGQGPCRLGRGPHREDQVSLSSEGHRRRRGLPGDPEEPHGEAPRERIAPDPDRRLPQGSRLSVQRLYDPQGDRIHRSRPQAQMHVPGGHGRVRDGSGGRSVHQGRHAVRSRHAVRGPQRPRRAFQIHR